MAKRRPPRAKTPPKPPSQEIRESFLREEERDESLEKTTETDCFLLVLLTLATAQSLVVAKCGDVRGEVQICECAGQDHEQTQPEADAVV